MEYCCEILKPMNSWFGDLTVLPSNGINKREATTDGGETMDGEPLLILGQRTPERIEMFLLKAVMQCHQSFFASQKKRTKFLVGRGAALWENQCRQHGQFIVLKVLRRIHMAGSEYVFKVPALWRLCHTRPTTFTVLQLGACLQCDKLKTPAGFEPVSVWEIMKRGFYQMKDIYLTGNVYKENGFFPRCS